VPIESLWSFRYPLCRLLALAKNSSPRGVTSRGSGVLRARPRTYTGVVRESGVDSDDQCTAMRLKIRWSLLLLASSLCLLERWATGAEKDSEPRCSADKFECKSNPQFPHSDKVCIPRNWVCDGRDDCQEGDDEADCENPVTCSQNQFQCPTGNVPCISKGWQCDGEHDCEDGADEAPELCDLVDQFKCLPNNYRCPGTHHCIHYSKLCDGVVDCPQTGTNLGKCEKYCKETIQGAECYCDAHEQFNTTTSACEDIDECQYDSFCDQDCANVMGGYNCTCRPGYELLANSRCIVTDPKPMLLIANPTSIQLVQMNGGELQPPYSISSREMISSLDFDAKNQSICWVVHGSMSPMRCASASDSNEGWTISTQYSLDFVHQAVKDWISGNWYFMDDVKEQIFMCTADGSRCRSVIHIDLHRPKSLALDPTAGYLFYADWSTSAVIGRADLDGANVKLLVQKKIVHPHGITLDYVKRHVYWGDSFLDFIERVDYAGNDRRVIAHGLNVLHVFSMALLENNLYIINHHNNSIVRLHRYDSLQPAALVTSTVMKPNTIKVFHNVRQPVPAGFEDICQKKACGHFCVMVPGADGVVAKCVCKEGYRLVNDAQCEGMDVSSYLLYANAQQGTVRSVAMDTKTVEDVQEPIVNLIRPVALAVDPRNNDIYFSDMSTRHIGRYSAATGKTTILLNGTIVSPTCEGLAVDFVGDNLYWTDNAYDAIFVASLKNMSLVTKVINVDLTHPKSIALDPLNGMMYWTDWKAKIESAKMDGTDRKTLAKEEVYWPNGLSLDVDNRKLYCTEAHWDRILSIDLNCTTNCTKTVVNGTYLQHPYGIVANDGKLYWTEAIKGEVRRWDGAGKMTIIRNDSKPIFDLVMVTPAAPTLGENHPCKKENRCTDFCLSTGPDTYNCSCAVNRELQADGYTCTGKVQALPCAHSQFACEDEEHTCIPLRFKCDGQANCPDGSDESDKTWLFMCDHDMFDCGNRRCIFAQFVCDGERDCLHGTDESEENCKNHSCPEEHSKCANFSQCIPDVWRCDGENDCPDGSDEGGDCVYNTTACLEFICATGGRCIPNSYVCDQEKDCADGSDERNCDQWCDFETEFRCKNDSVCLPNIYQCDGERNCKDGTDELNCLVDVNITCHANEFRCATDGSCIPNFSLCDGIEDCIDKSDEKDCGNGTKQCHWSEFKCEDGSRCIPSAWKCDGDRDCHDRSDEKNCLFGAPCPLPNFQCKNNSNHCLPPNKMCDGVNDCADHSDEGRLCVYDLCLNHDCSDICYKSPDGYTCGCDKYRRLSPDNKTCVDTDICEHWGICSQNCTAGSYPSGRMCSCKEGYERQPDGWTCLAKEKPYVIFSRRHEIRQLSLKDKNTVSLVSGLRNTIALDFLWEKKWLFWTDVGDDKIYRGTIMSNTVTDIQRIVDVGLATTEGIAVDWVAGNIYWVESNLDQIEVAKWDGSNRTTLLAGAMQSPRAIVLDPRERWLFWTDWDGEYPRIERCDMSGENRSVIYDIRTVHGGGWPNGLAVDYDAHRLYWVDAKSDSVHCITYDGADHRLIMTSKEYLYHPFSLTLFEHYIYWTDWRYNSLVRANKFNGSDVEVIQRTYTQPFDVKIFHPKRQPPVTLNPCQNNGNCSHLCLLKVDPPYFRCKCPHRYRLGKDNKTCE
ncbi:hypothetical protein BaRGS_00001281, partial [Batillaria attramentaria]